MAPDDWRARDVLDRLRDYSPDVSGMDDIDDAIAEIVRLRAIVDQVVASDDALDEHARNKGKLI